MQTYSGLAVMDDAHIYRVGTCEPHEATDLRSVLEASEMRGIDHVWIIPGSELSTRCSDVAANLEGWSSAASYCDPKARDKYNYVSARRNEKRHEDRIQIGMSEWLYWPWKVDRPRTLLATPTYLQNDLGVPIEWSPAHVGIDYLKLNHQYTWNWFQPNRINLEQQIPSFLYGNTCKEIHWRARTLPPGARVIKIDKNSDHGAACTGVRLGQGEPEFIDPAGIPAFYDGKRPGFWRVDYSYGKSLFDGLRAPALKNFGWMTTDMVEQARKIGYHVDIKSGWAWKEYHQALRKPLTELWTLRTQARKDREKSQAHENVYKSINAVMHAIPGRLGDTDGRDLHFRRRDYWAMIVARAISTGIYNIWQIYHLFGLLPVLQDVDALIYVVDNPDPVKVFPGFLNRDKLGSYKDEWVLKRTKEVEELWANPANSGKHIMKCLNEMHKASMKQVNWC